jgi:hypothetical protein
MLAEAHAGSSPAGALAGIYPGIAVAIPCPADAFWGRR